MEALEPVLKQKFWILLGVGILMTFIGWWMATGQISAAITDRTNKIDAAEKSVPTSEVPNEAWTKRLAEINGKQESSIKATRLGLWKRQQQRMTLPAGVPPSDYEDKLKNEDRELFRDNYPMEVRRVWKVLNPMDMDGSGVVNFPLSSMVRVLNQKPWINAPPKSETIWEVMEDLWLLEGLFESIAEVNGGIDAGRPEASVHQIDRLELRGGGEKISTGSGGGGDDAMMSGFGGPPGMAMGMGMRGGGGSETSGMAGGNMGGSLPTVSAEFDVREEFGDDGSGAGLGGGNVGGGGGAPGGAPAGMMGAMAMMQQGAMSGMDDMDMGSGSTQGEKVVKRYITEDESLPYKTRGFYLSVKMDHRKIPQLIAELTANDRSAWPVEIVRVQMARLHEDDETYASGYSGGAGMRMSMGYPGAGGVMPPGGPMSAMGMRRDRDADDEFDSFNSAGFAGGNMNLSPATMLAQKASQESLEIALRDPYMAQVTLCGIITMYRKVEEAAPEASSDPAADSSASEVSEDAVDPEMTDAAPDRSSSEANETPSDDATAGSNEISEASPAENSESGVDPAEPSGDAPAEQPAPAKSEEEKTEEDTTPAGEEN